MSQSNTDDALLLIRCPSCGQRFKVGEDLRGRTVECGACEHRFRINDEVIVRGKKFYPGERKNPALNRFPRVPLSVAPSSEAVPLARYAEPPKVSAFEPASPQQIIAGVAGASGMVLIALLLMFGGRPGGSIDGMVIENRLLMAGFTGLLGTSLLFYANPRARGKATAIGLLMALALLSIPFFFKAGSAPLDMPVERPGVTVSIPGHEKTSSDPLEDLRGRIGTAPLNSEIERLAREGSTRKAVGLWLRDLRGQNRLLVRDYILRVTGADLDSHYYPRGEGDILMVVTGINQSLEEFAKSASALGSVENTYPELSVVEVRVNNESFVSGPIEKLTDKTDPAFYDLNKRELESIDLERVSKAVKRLAEAEPKVYRADITRKFIFLLGAKWVDFKGDVCRALSVWSDTPGIAGDAALKEVKDLLARHKDVPEDMIALIVKEKNPGVIHVLEELWKNSPTRWESLYADVGQAAEGDLLRFFPQTDGMLRQSAVRLIGRVGSADSLPVLEAANANADAELKVLIRKSSESIRKRMSP